MTSWLARVGAFFLEPPADDGRALPDAGALAPHRGGTPAGGSSDAVEPACPSTWLAPSSPYGGSVAGRPDQRRGPQVAGEEAAEGRAAIQRRGSQVAGEEAGERRAAIQRRGSQVADEERSGWTQAAVLGAPAAVVPVAAACAGELRARAGAAAAVICIWRPVGGKPEIEADAPAARTPAGATTPGARRLAARLAAQELAATACGRLAWLALEPDAARALDQTERCLRAAAAPVVLAVAGARPAAFEPLLAQLDLAVAVLPADTEPALRVLARATLRARDRVILPPLVPGPPRWAAMAGLARLRSLPPLQAEQRQ